MDVAFWVVGGKKYHLTISESELASEVKLRLSKLLDKPASAIKLIHNAAILCDDFLISSVLSSRRTTICVKIDEPMHVNVKFKPELPESSSAPNNRLGEVGTLLRNFILENPAAVPQLIAAVSDAFPDTNGILSSNPDLLLDVVGITPQELLTATETRQNTEREMVRSFIDNMTPDDFAALQQISLALPDTSLELIIRTFVISGRDIQTTISRLTR